jgi:hypothetical protein
MDVSTKIRTLIDFYAALVRLWWLKRRIYLKWEREKELFSSDFL